MGLSPSERVVRGTRCWGLGGIDDGFNIQDWTGRAILAPDSCPLTFALRKMKVTPEMLMKTNERGKRNEVSSANWRSGVHDPTSEAGSQHGTRCDADILSPDF